MSIKPYPKLLQIGEYELNKNAFTLTHARQRKDSSGRKRRIEYSCDECAKPYITKLRDEIKKQHPWLCRSCRTKKQFEDPTIKENHKRSQNRPEVLAHRSKISRQTMLEKWADPTERKKMLTYLQKARDAHESKLLNDPQYRASINKRKRGTRVYHKSTSTGDEYILRSKLEQQVAIALDNAKIDWKYEPKQFKLKSLDCSYTPDFYLPDVDLWIEVKGFWRKQSKAKWSAFCKEYPGNKCVLMHHDVAQLEILINENRIKEASWYPKSF